MQIPGFTLDLLTSLFTVFGHFAFDRRSIVYLFDRTANSVGLVVGRVVASFVASYHHSFVSAVSCHFRLFGSSPWHFGEHRVPDCPESEATAILSFCLRMRFKKVSVRAESTRSHHGPTL